MSRFLAPGSKNSSRDLEGGGGSASGTSNNSPSGKMPGAGDRELPLSQQLPIDRQFAEAPRAKLERLQPEVESIFEKAILQLEVLRGQERALGPENWFELLHRIVARRALEANLRPFSTRLLTITIPAAGSKGQIKWGKLSET